MKTQRFTLEQHGEADPQKEVIENSFLGPVPALRIGLGHYRLASPTNEFAVGKTTVDIPRMTVADDEFGQFVFVRVECTSTDEINITTFADAARTIPREWCKHPLDGGFHTITVLD